MAPLKNWDNKTWLSSKKYIHKFNSFVLKQVKLDKNSRILDIGCGRGKILDDLSNKLRLSNRPIGLDIENHKDKSKKIIFKKTDALTFISKTNITFDLILIKQTIHLLKKKQVIKLLSICKNKLNVNGKIIILSLDSKKIEIPLEVPTIDPIMLEPRSTVPDPESIRLEQRFNEILKQKKEEDERNATSGLAFFLGDKKNV